MRKTVNCRSRHNFRNIFLHESQDCELSVRHVSQLSLAAVDFLCYDISLMRIEHLKQLNTTKPFWEDNGCSTSCLLWNQLVRYLVQKTSLLVATLNYMIQVYTFPFLRLFIIYAKFSFLFFSDSSKNFVFTSFFSDTCHMYGVSHLVYFITAIIYGEDYKLWSFWL